jgi:hypothetical protein
MWNQEIELSEHELLTLGEVFSILRYFLAENEIEEFAQELLRSIGKGEPDPDPFDCQLDG